MNDIEYTCWCDWVPDMLSNKTPWVKLDQNTKRAFRECLVPETIYDTPMTLEVFEFESKKWIEAKPFFWNNHVYRLKNIWTEEEHRNIEEYHFLKI
jgi:hypothetical protein